MRISPDVYQLHAGLAINDQTLFGDRLDPQLWHELLDIIAAPGSRQNDRMFGEECPEPAEVIRMAVRDDDVSDRFRRYLLSDLGDEFLARGVHIPDTLDGRFLEHRHVRRCLDRYDEIPK